MYNRFECQCLYLQEGEKSPRRSLSLEVTTADPLLKDKPLALIAFMLWRVVWGSNPRHPA